jgi:hypothetical protein
MNFCLFSSLYLLRNISVEKLQDTGKTVRKVLSVKDYFELITCIIWLNVALIVGYFQILDELFIIFCVTASWTIIVGCRSVTYAVTIFRSFVLYLGVQCQWLERKRVFRYSMNQWNLSGSSERRLLFWYLSRYFMSSLWISFLSFSTCILISIGVSQCQRDRKPCCCSRLLVYLIVDFISLFCNWKALFRLEATEELTVIAAEWDQLKGVYLLNTM